MPFKVKIKSPAIREAQIKSSVAASKEKQEFYDFRNARTELLKIRIPQDLLLYRMENFRTFTEQRAYLNRQGKPEDFFLSGQENQSVQQIQHEILSKLARQGRAESVVPVIDVLRTEKQREPLLITYGGVIVNGNRRLAAMRELLDEDEKGNQEFNSVTCLVLPEDATPEDIVDIEASLQGRPETKLDYDWIGDAELIKRLKQLGRTDKQLADRLNRRPAEIKNAIAALSEANLYLSDWAKAEGEYIKVREAEQLFKDLPTRIQDKEQSLADASRVIAWTLLDNKDKLGERLYAFNATFGESAGNVLDRMSSELGVGLGGSEDVEEDDFAVDIDSSTSVSYQPLIDLLKDTAKRAEATETLIEICREVVEEERGKKTGTAALRAVSAANSKLVEVELGKADPSTHQAISRQLDQILRKAGELKLAVDKLVKTKADGGRSNPDDGK